MPASLRRLSIAFVPVLFLSSLAKPAIAQSAKAVAASARITAPVNAGVTTRLTGQVPVYADTTRLPSTALDPSASFSHLTVVLSRSPQVEAAFDQLLTDQLNPASPRFHQWLLPAQVGELYGPAQSDIDAVVSWLTSQGLTVTDISPNRLYVNFSGPVSLVSTAFATSFRTFSLANGESRYSLIQEPSVPAAVAPVIKTIVGLSQSIHIPTLRHGELITPESTKSGSTFAKPLLNATSGAHYLVAGDFATAYDVGPVYSAGIDGTGQNIAIVGVSRINALDISRLQAIEGLTAKQPNTTVPPSGVDPGAVGDANPGVDQGSQDEATLDVNRTNGTAPGATLDLIVSGDIGAGTTTATDGLFIAINYAIGTKNDPILSISFGGCEYLNGSASDTYEDSLFKTAASQGISTFISAGDSGAAACNAFSTSTHSYAQILSMNDFCATQYVTCLGGTQFVDTTSPSTYWNSTNAANGSSLLSYIPEGAWNEVSVDSKTGNYDQGSTGGGVSIYLPEPTWQTGVGVPQTSFRWIPDVSLTSSTHDGFVTCLNYLNATCGSFYGFGGTSAAAPSMAGIQALLNQKLGGRQGNINPTLYALAATTSNGVYHDTTVASSGVTSCTTATPSLCNNSVPGTTTLTGGLAGYAVTTGWDASTGWGSIDVKNLLSSWPTFTVTPTTTTFTVAAGATSSPDTITLASANNFAGTVALTCAVTNASGTAAGSCALTSTSATLAAGSTATSSLTVTPSAGTTGTLHIVVTATTGNPTSISVTSSVITVTVSGFTVTPTSGSLSIAAGGTTGNTDMITLASVNAFSGNIALTCTAVNASGTATGTCSVAPTPVTLAAGGTIPSTVTVLPTAGTSGTLNVVVTGTSGATVETSSNIVVTVTSPSFTLTPAASTLSLAAGATTTDVITLTSTGGFVGNVNLTCAVANAGGTAAGTCTILPTPATLTIAGTATSTLTVLPTAGTGGKLSVTITGTSGATVVTSSPIIVTVSNPAGTFTLTPASSALTFTAGAAIGNTDVITVASPDGLSAAVNLSCTIAIGSGTANLPPTCAMSPAAVTLSVGTASATSTATITSTASSTTCTVQNIVPALPWRVSGGVFAAFALILIPLRKRKSFRNLLALGLLALGMSLVSGCGGGGSTPTCTNHTVAGTTAGAYTVTVTGTSGSTTVTKTFGVTIQ
ncbi:MAG TPA: protease pro-enzyme activation domain-containing protein [Acidobacteriaceae bacterium]|jgi:subtilase family serine protease